MIIYYTDGSCNPNPGPGGFAVVKDKEWVITGHDKETTNIRMEGQALMSALKDADGRECKIHSDSEFWINSLTKWATTWESKGWQKKGGEIKNLELVKEVYWLYKQSNAKLIWVRGHVGNLGNEQADEWANKARIENLTGKFLL